MHLLLIYLAPHVKKLVISGKIIQFVWKSQGKVRENEICNVVGTTYELQCSSLQWPRSGRLKGVNCPHFSKFRVLQCSLTPLLTQSKREQDCEKCSSPPSQ